jgi:hypothetical protein
MERNVVGVHVHVHVHERVPRVGGHVVAYGCAHAAGSRGADGLAYSCHAAGCFHHDVVPLPARYGPFHGLPVGAGAQGLGYLKPRIRWSYVSEAGPPDEPFSACAAASAAWEDGLIRRPTAPRDSRRAWRHRQWPPAKNYDGGHWLVRQAWLKFEYLPGLQA